MNKHLVIIGMTLVLLAVGLSGCVDIPDIPDELLQFSIISFYANPSMIRQGETVNLSWIVINAISVNIDHEIGNVSLIGSRIITPNETTTYKLTAKNATTTKTVTTHVIVRNETDEEDKIPEILWMIDQDENTIEIIKGDVRFAYAASKSNANFIFKTSRINYYIKDDFSLTANEVDLNTNTITAEDTITGFADGTTYSVVWESTDTIIGTAVFSGKRTPKLLWQLDQDDNEMEIIQVDAIFEYAASSTNANLIFKTNGINYYVKDDFSLTTIENSLNTNDIIAGDVITSFADGTTYSVIWEPTDITIGIVFYN